MSQIAYDIRYLEDNEKKKIIITKNRTDLRINNNYQWNSIYLCHTHNAKHFFFYFLLLLLLLMRKKEDELNIGRQLRKTNNKHIYF